MNQSSLLLYIHGFNSSPQSHKANVMAEYCQTHRPDIKVITPQMACFPEEAASQLLEIVEQHRRDYRIALIGSSLGGYLSVWLNHKFGFKAAVINPAVRPYELLQDYLGEQENPYTGQKYMLEDKHIDQLRTLDVAEIQAPTDFWLLQQEGDEILDYRDAVVRFKGAKQTVEPNGDHSFVNFERYPSQIIEFLEL
ncbi:esterase YqiA [Vibrio sonorensis]|uniref:esterase YqiA n=1 Tax=Vibrio sonorensis TaxID=1004316 RepID=UPI0008DA8EA5|nr:esterase YqiA [Vibrio sonorensis]